VLLNRSERSVIALLAILKTGAAYLPLDTQLPVGRLQLILHNATPAVVITETAVLENISIAYQGLLPTNPFRWRRTRTPT
jgi:non-ribosomal peptide synthetase component F